MGSRWGPLFFMVGTMKRSDIVSEVGMLLQPITRSMGLETVDLQVAGEAQRTVLRVLVDRPDGGITDHAEQHPPKAALPIHRLRGHDLCAPPGEPPELLVRPERPVQPRRGHLQGIGVREEVV